MCEVNVSRVVPLVPESRFTNVGIECIKGNVPLVLESRFTNVGIDCIKGCSTSSREQIYKCGN